MENKQSIDGFEAISSSDEEKTSDVPILTNKIQGEVSEKDGQPELKETPQDQKPPKIFIVTSLDNISSLLERPELANLGCSYRGKYEYQVWFSCDTCFPDDDNKGVCLGCTKQCLANGHEIDPRAFQYSPFFCDHGHQKAGYPKIDNDEEEGEEGEEEISEESGESEQDEEEEIPEKELGEENKMRRRKNQGKGSKYQPLIESD